MPADKYKNCLPQGEDTRSFYDYTSEDIEKMTNVSFSEPEYQGKVLMNRFGCNTQYGDAAGSKAEAVAIAEDIRKWVEESLPRLF